MMGLTMKSAALLLCVIVCATALVCNAAGPKSVYLLPMANGMDQYLANRLTASGLFQVIADPKKAEAIFTDKLGEVFEERLDTIFPPAQTKKEKADKDKETEVQPMRSSSFGRAKGTLFLVDTASRNVLWSVYQPPKNTTPAELDRTARRIVEQLKGQGKGK
jgi:hypothetical protein